MPILSKELRQTLENTVADARRIAEAGAEQTLKQLAVHHSESWPGMTSQEKALREKLRAHGKQLGDNREPNRTQEIARLKQACAYEHWHRMLFARFLAENNLLIHPDYGEPISLDEVKEMAREQNVDWLLIAASFAQRMLIEVFRPDDPVLELVLPPETRQKLEERLAALPVATFTAEDSLGWVYQFWQRDEKDEVNKSEVKIGADELAPVTQLFTEDYMVLFLLHNTLGAWWTAKCRTEGKNAALPEHEWTYLRLNEEGSPAAGDYLGWPKAARHLRVIDPCMGSGHFLTFALPILARMRMEEEGFQMIEAVTAVLRDNLFGLELDARCSQIAAFNLAMTAWKLVGGHFALPSLNLACSGLGVNATEADWAQIAGHDSRAQETMLKLYLLFRQAPILGSLIDPTRIGGNLFQAEFAEVRPLLEQALAAEQETDDARELAIAARGVLAAARLLAAKFTLVVTNVPYLGRGRQNDSLASYCERFHSDAKTDLATCVLDRSINFAAERATIALVTKQEPFFQTTYADFRKRLLGSVEWNSVARLGPRAFEGITGERVNVALLTLTARRPPDGHSIATWDVSESRTPAEKAETLQHSPCVLLSQSAQHRNPGSKIIFEESSDHPRLSRYAAAFQGIKTGDDDRVRRLFSEFPQIEDRWHTLQSTVKRTQPFGGLSEVIDWAGEGQLLARKQGLQAWGKVGVMVSQMQDMPAALYTGSAFDSNGSPIIPIDHSNLPAIWAFCASTEYVKELRLVDQSLKPTNSSLVQVSFDLNKWQRVAEEDYPSGLPMPHSDDPTQWLFAGHPKNSKYPLQVAVGRLVGYRWPRQTGANFPGCPALEPDGLEIHADGDGLLSLSSLAGEAPAADRLRALLADAFGSEWSAAKLAELLGDFDSLEVWLRDHFFAQHCDIFENRPFVWHVWDGRKDGFHALVNYHRLAAANREGRKTLEKLIYTALGDWISRQKAEVSSGADGADARLAAAQYLQSELEKILAGEDPYDIFVRWKPIHEQPIGWEPDVNDGVRINIRPWLTAKLAPQTKPKKGACILRVTPKITYGKDRGKESARHKTDFPWFADSTDRNNDIHLSLHDKRDARERRNK